MLLMACILVFSFALHAKVGLYAAGARPDASTASKLWMDDAEWQVSPIAPIASMTWLAVFLFSLLTTLQVRRYVAAPAAIVHEQCNRQYLHRFLRPPPKQ
jgi:hypothetical protein